MPFMSTLLMIYFENEIQQHVLQEQLYLQHGMNEPGEPLYAQINRDLKTKRMRSTCGGNDGNDLLLMTATTAMSSTTSTIRSEEYIDTTSASNVSTLKLKNRSKVDIAKSDIGADVYKNLNNNNNNHNNNNANNNQNQWV